MQIRLGTATSKKQSMACDYTDEDFLVNAKRGSLPR